nr:Unknown Function [uncultured bacterium]
MKLPYDEMKHINGRDENPKRGLAKPERYDRVGIAQRRILISKEPPYESVEVKAKEPNADPSLNPLDDVELQSNGKLLTYEVGNPDDKDCKWATIWLHGATPQRGDLGVIDNIFGGAFNRMKHLAQENHGLYYSPYLNDFGSEDKVAISALIKRIRTTTCPKGKIIVSCGSAGTSVCWDLASDKDIVKDISGLVLIGSAGGPNGNLKDTEAVKARIPILFAQGERDHPDYWKDLVSQLHRSDPDYPIRFVLYQSGGHMTPLRMLDWRETMNCMLTQAPEVSTSLDQNRGQSKEGAVKASQ